MAFNGTLKNLTALLLLAAVLLNNIHISSNNFIFSLNDPIPDNSVISAVANHPLEFVFNKLGILPEDYEFYTTNFVILPLIFVGIGGMAIPVALVMLFLFSWGLLFSLVEYG